MSLPSKPHSRRVELMVCSLTLILPLPHWANTVRRAQDESEALSLLAAEVKRMIPMVAEAGMMGHFSEQRRLRCQTLVHELRGIKESIEAMPLAAFARMPVDAHPEAGQL